jgi:hypothetical protein
MNAIRLFLLALTKNVAPIVGLTLGFAFLAPACDSSPANASGAGGSSSTGGTGGASAGDTSKYLGPPTVTLGAAQQYFMRSGVAQPILMRNIAANSAAEAVQLLDVAKNGGTRLVRFQLTQGFGYTTLGITSKGDVVESVASDWDKVIDAAADRGIAIIPVFAIWGDWNDGTPDYGWSHWSANPLNQANGGPAAQPSELLSNTTAQQRWLGWLSKLVTRWQARANIAAWETFSEIDLLTGSTEATAVAFAETAASTVRALDTYKRPLMMSTSDLNEWTNLWASNGNDIVQLHPYGNNLDDLILQHVKTRLAAGKPVLIGESGLDAANPDGTTIISTNANAKVGLRHAVWAGLVSGALDARAFYWEDGYAVFFPQTGMSLVNQYATVESTAVTFLGTTEFTGLSPAAVTNPATLFGAALAGSNLVVAWFRDASCIAPWNCTASVASASVSITLPAAVADGNWSVTLYDPVSGTSQSPVPATVSGATLNFTLPAFTDSIVLRAQP